MTPGRASPSALPWWSGVGAVVGASMLLVGCPAPLRDPSSAWQDQVQPTDVCYSVNLLDGLDEASTGELHAVFACVDSRGMLAGFRRVDAAWDTDTRDGPAGLVFARWINGLSLGELHQSTLDEASALLDDPTPLLDAAHLLLEVAWGAPWPWIGLRVDPTSPTAWSEGLVAPILPVVGGAATVLIDEPAVLSPVSRALRSSGLREIAWAAALASTSTDPAVAALADSWPDDVAALVTRAADPSNDRWSGASGDSLRDVAQLLLVRQGSDGRTILTRVTEPALPILADPASAARLRATLEDDVAHGRLDALGVEALHLTAVDSRGGALEAGEDSALVALLRLLATTNQEVSCEVPVIGVEVSLGNLAVSLLQTIAGLDPDTAVTGVGVLSTLLGVPLTDDALGLLQDQCPVLGDHFVDDIHAVDRLVDPSSGTLLPVLIGALQALSSTGTGEADHIPDLVDTVGALYAEGLVPPIEEVLRDVADGPLFAHVIDLVPVLLEPEAHVDVAALPAGVNPVSFESVWTLAGDVLAPGDDGIAPADALQPLSAALLMPAGTWTAEQRLGALLDEPEALIRGVLPKAADLLADDPYLDAAGSLADLLDTPEDLRAPLVLVEGEGLRAAVVDTTAEEPGVVPTLTEWTVDGTVDVLVTTLQSLAALLPA